MLKNDDEIICKGHASSDALQITGLNVGVLFEMCGPFFI
jgi:hypothetical protein